MNVRDGGEGERRWEEAGRPIVPSLVVGDTVTPILHRSQIAALLDLPAAAEGQATTLARDATGILDAWVEHLRAVPFELLVAPTPSRGRSLRNLTVNVFHPFELLPEAFRSGLFEWDPERDGEREASLADIDAVVSYADGIVGGWRRFVDEPETLDVDLEVASLRGPISWSNLLAQQRWHAAFHYRQLTAFLADEGEPVDHPFRLEGLDGLDLPSEVF